MLEQVAALEPVKVSLIERRVRLEEESCALVGPPAVGKSMLLYDHYLTQPKNTLFLDLTDARLGGWRPTTDELEEFCRTHKIARLFLDHYDGSFELPKVETLFVASRNEVEGVPNLMLMAPDFEESLAFLPKRLQDHPEQAFAQLLKEGMLPEILQAPDYRRLARLDEILRLALPDEVQRALFSFIARYTAHKSTPHHLYTRLKEERPLSKDKLYDAIGKLERTGMVIAVEKIGQPSAPRKLYPYDFGFKLAASFARDPHRLIETMTLLELVKEKRQPYYAEALDLILPDEQCCYLVMPFSTLEQIRSRIFKLYGDLLAFGIERVIVVTTGVDEEFGFEGIECEIKPFWTWRLGN